MLSKKVLASVLGLSLVVGSSSAVSAALSGGNTLGNFAELMEFPACRKILVEDVVKPTLSKTGAPDVQNFYFELQSFENSTSTDIAAGNGGAMGMKSLEQSFRELYENNSEFRRAYDDAWSCCGPRSKKERWGSRFCPSAIRKRWGSRF